LEEVGVEDRSGVAKDVDGLLMDVVVAEAVVCDLEVGQIPPRLWKSPLNL